MGVYHIGVGHCLHERVPELVNELDGFYGTSAGSIVAVCLAVGATTQDGNDFAARGTEAVHKSYLGAFSPFFNPNKLIDDFLEELLPPNAHRDLRNKVKISVTELPYLKNKIISDFNTRKELIKAVVGSSFIPVFSGYAPPSFRGKRIVDGGFSDNVPFSKDSDVISVSPFPGDFDICPEEEPHYNFQHYFQIANMALQFNVTSWWRIKKCIFVPSMAELQKIQRQGYRDTLKFLKLRGLVSEPIHRPYMALRDCIPVKGVDKENPEWHREEEPSNIPTLPHLRCTVGLEAEMWMHSARVHCDSQTSDYFSDTSSPGVLSRSTSLSNVLETANSLSDEEEDEEDDTISPEEDEKILQTFRSTKRLCSRRRSNWTTSDFMSPKAVSFLWHTVYSTIHAKDQEYQINLFQKANNLWKYVLNHSTEPFSHFKV